MPPPHSVNPRVRPIWGVIYEQASVKWAAGENGIPPSIYSASSLMYAPRNTFRGAPFMDMASLDPQGLAPPPPAESNFLSLSRTRLRHIKPGDPLDGFENPLPNIPDTQSGTIHTADGKRVKRNGKPKKSESARYKENPVQLGLWG